MQHPLRHCQPVKINWPVISGQSEEFRGDSCVPRIGLLIGADSDSVSRWWWWWCLDAGGSPPSVVISIYLSIYLPASLAIYWLITQNCRRRGCCHNRVSNFAPCPLIDRRRVVLKEITNIDDGIGAPDLNLSMALLVSWAVIGLVLMRGIHSSGKASYFLAIFPYVIMVVLLVRSVTLEGASIGINYFFKPQWDRILDPEVRVTTRSQRKWAKLSVSSPSLPSLSSGVVRSCFAGVFLPRRLFWQHHYVLVVQQVPPQCV